MNRLYLLEVLVIGFIAIATGCCGKDEQRHLPEEPVGLEEHSSSLVDITLRVRNSDVIEGVIVRAEVENTSQSPRLLTVCPHMLMSYVMGSYVVFRQEGWGIGLLDICRGPKPCPGEKMLLPPNASFASNVRIPAGNIPESVRQKGKNFSVQLLYEPGEQGPAKSNIVQAKWY